MGNNCCKKPDDDIIYETYQSNEINNLNINKTEIKNIDENPNKNKDKYPHDSDFAFRNKKE